MKLCMETLASGDYGRLERYPLPHVENRYHHILTLTPDALTLRGRQVDALHWWTEADCPQPLRALVERPHALETPDFLRLMEGVSTDTLCLSTPDMVLAWQQGERPRFSITQRPRDLCWTLPPMDRTGCLELMAELVGLGSRIAAVDFLTQLAGKPVRG